jgi:hypothetical protein
MSLGLLSIVGVNLGPLSMSKKGDGEVGVWSGMWKLGGVGGVLTELDIERKDEWGASERWGEKQRVPV